MEEAETVPATKKRSLPKSSTKKRQNKNSRRIIQESSSDNSSDDSLSDDDTPKKPHAKEAARTKTNTSQMQKKQRRKASPPPPMQTDDNDDDDSSYSSTQHLNSDEVPTAMFRKYSGSTPFASDTPLLAQHREIFMCRAFHQEDDSQDHSSEEGRAKSSLRSEDELENICFILKHWGGTINLKTMEDGKRKKKLAAFRRRHRVGKHHVGRFHFNSITLPNGEKCNILRRIEKNAIGRIVVSRERVFDAINKWHRSGTGHFGAERTWTSCKDKYWNCTIDIIYCQYLPLSYYNVVIA